MLTLNGLGGAGALMPSSVVAPTLSRTALTWDSPRRGARTRARAPRTISPGTVALSTKASPSSLAAPGSGFALHGVGGAVGAAGSLAVSNSTVVMSPPDIPSTRAWWFFATNANRPPDMLCTSQISHRGLERSSRCEKRRPASRFSAASSAGFGKAVWRVEEGGPVQPLQRRVVGGLRQSGVADVVVGVEMRVVAPHRAPLAEWHEGEALAVARHEMQPVDHVLDQILQRGCLAV